MPGLLEMELERVRLARKLAERGLLGQVDPGLLWQRLGVISDAQRPQDSVRALGSPFADAWGAQGWPMPVGPDVEHWRRFMEQKAFGPPRIWGM